MRILLDENIDRLLKPLFDRGHEVVTVGERGWNGKQNGELLRAAAQEFDVFVTMDRNLPYQQNLEILTLAVIVIHARNNTFSHVSPLMPKVNAAITLCDQGVATVVRA